MKTVFAILAVLALMISVSGCISTGPEVDAAKEAGLPILVRHASPSRPNSAGGVNLHIRFVNTDSKPYRYVIFTARAFDRVGGLAISSVGRRISEQVRYIGPVEPGEGTGGGMSWKNVWYNHSIRCVEVTGIRIEYMDGSELFIDEDDVARHLGEEAFSSCPLEFEPTWRD